jgi:hypothetical protein
MPQKQTSESFAPTAPGQAAFPRLATDRHEQHASGDRSSAIGFIADAWPHLPVHVRESILTLVEFGTEERHGQ